ncbi:TetR/AcrR family transcriptional regulator [Saccharopolyspora rosea]|uniref:TetR/AcrR family transcriptional regulator n=1 Tax=Saccharopolyspora rosea TaxID=524884 RepID=A0ABW3FN99_9PSEU|nr:TetR/AcrR family transcriptional regulator [Saccharopolyspora rosea]
MGRPREFDEERAVEGAMRAFWASGYARTSTQELCEATGLGRSSIYNTFTSKHALFLKSLRRYMARIRRRQAEVLESELPVREKLRRLLELAVEDEFGDQPGCLVVNSILELSDSDEEVAAELRRDYDRRIAVLRGIVEDARRRGEVGADVDPEAFAHFIATTVSGMRIAAKNGASREVVESIAETALRAL